MKLLNNQGNDRVIDELRRVLPGAAALDVATPTLSLHAFAELADSLPNAPTTRILIPDAKSADWKFTGGDADRPFRNRLETRALAARLAEWVEKKAHLKLAHVGLPQSAFIVHHAQSEKSRAITGDCPLSTEGIGVSPGNRFSLIHQSESPAECAMFANWFEAQWQSLHERPAQRAELIAALRDLAARRAPTEIYYLTLYNLFKDLGAELDEERIVKSGTGIRETIVWKKLFKFQRDGTLGAIDKLERLGGCIIADSVGLGKTFEALAVIKYYELRNDRVLVLCPKRLRDNWTLYKANDRRNILAADRFHYDVLNHTDLSREDGLSGDIDLTHVNWGNYDLVVIDESHNFRNKKSPRQGGETRYDKLMRRIIREGVKTRVLMLSATPVNNRLADLRNQLAFVTEGIDDALAPHGIPSIESTLRLSQIQFNLWQRLPQAERTTARLMEMLGFDYFKLLDLLTIARSRKHIRKYYGIAETGDFPERMLPVNIKADIDLDRTFPHIRTINDEIRRLTLASYAPLRYLLASRAEAYDAKYSVSVKGGRGTFRQIDREESLVHLMRVNLLKRMESSVASFALTLSRQLADVEATLAKLDNGGDAIEDISIEEVDIDDPAFEPLLVGRRVKVLLSDIDRVRWRQDLQEDRNRLAALLANSRQVGAKRDAKLDELKRVISDKIANPLNAGNRKVIVFTAFADTARYLYDELSGWAHPGLGLRAALITGSGTNRTNLPGARADLATLLSAFSPRSKGRPADLADEGEIDLLVATDCISEGQNLQDCDCLINYDIHWNPVRIIQRFGRIDRIGSPNTRIRLVNFWPNIDLEEYIGLEQRVCGRMALLDISATGEENLIEQTENEVMNDLEYRRLQLEQLQHAIPDIEDLSGGVAITDLTLNDFHVELAGFLKNNRERIEKAPLGLHAVVTESAKGESPVPPGILFCLRAAHPDSAKVADPSYPLAPHYLVHVGDDGAVLLPHTQAKSFLDRLRKAALGRDLADPEACARFDRATRDGHDMTKARELLAKAVHAIVGKKEERAVASLFTPGGTHTGKTDFAGVNDFEVVAFLVVLPQEA